MATEIERKFLPSNSFNAFIEQINNPQPDDRYTVLSQIEIVQGYISQQVGRTVRLRASTINGVTSSMLNFKGNSTDGGLSHPEYEFEIPSDTAVNMFLDLVPTVLKKVRYEIRDNAGGLIWELDVFDSIVVIECEFDSVEASGEFIKPEWVGDEVTGNHEYYNSVIVDRVGVPSLAVFGA